MPKSTYRHAPPELTPDLVEGLCQSLGLQRTGTKRRIALVVKDHAVASFKEDVPLRPLQVYRELKRHAVRMQRDMQHLPQFSSDAEFYLSIAERDLPFTLAIEESLHFKLGSAIWLLEAECQSSESSKGGRPKDPRIQSFVMKLLYTFKQYTDLEPTHSSSPIDGSGTSKFDIFVNEAFRWFYPTEPVPWASVRDAIRELISFDRGDEEEISNWS